MSEKLNKKKTLFMTRLMTPDMSNFLEKFMVVQLKLLDEAACRTSIL